MVSEMCLGTQAICIPRPAIVLKTNLLARILEIKKARRIFFGPLQDNGLEKTHTIMQSNALFSAPCFVTFLVDC